MSTKKPKFINIRLEQGTYNELEKYARRRETWNEVVSRLLHDVGMVNFDLLTVDGTPPNTHIVEYQLGNAHYSYNKGKYALVDVKA